MRILACWIMIACVLLGAPRAFAQGTASPATLTPEQMQAFIAVLQADAKQYKEVVTKLTTENQDLKARVDGLEAPLWKKYVETKSRQYDFLANMMAVNEASYQHQKVANYVILVLVVFVVGAGLWFAYLQLMAGLGPLAQPVVVAPGAGAAQVQGAPPAPLGQAPPPAPPVAGNGGVLLGTTTMDVSLQKITVTSSVVGIIVLIISLAFLYIYTKEVYTIHVIDPFRPVVSTPNDAPGTPKPAEPVKK